MFYQMWGEFHHHKIHLTRLSSSLSGNYAHKTPIETNLMSRRGTGMTLTRKSMKWFSQKKNQSLLIIADIHQFLIQRKFT